MTWSCRAAGDGWTADSGPVPVLDLEAEAEPAPAWTVAPWPRWGAMAGIGSDRALALGATWWPLRSRGGRHVGGWLQWERSGALPEGWPASLGHDRGYWDRRIVGGVEVRW